jgi:hypothetical protein
MPCRSQLCDGAFVSLPPLLDADLAHLQRTNWKEDAMSDEIRNSEKTGSSGKTAVQRQWLSLDSWAVLLELAAAALVKLHILNSVTW